VHPADFRWRLKGPMFRAPLFQAQDIAMNSEEAGYQGIKQIVAKFGLSSSGVALRCGQHMVHHRAMCAYLRGSIGCTAKIAQSHCAVRFSQSVIGGIETKRGDRRA
jgi:hypothetical protein